jgi:hypothetical protein
MKQIFVAAICIGLSFTAAAQKVRRVAVYRPVYAIRPVVGFGIGYYPPFYSPFGYYGLPYGAYYPYGSMYSKPSKLEREEEAIRSDYADRIYSVRQDDRLTNKEKRQQIRALKKERKQQIHDLVVNYHKQPRNEKNDQQLEGDQSKNDQSKSEQSNNEQPKSEQTQNQSEESSLTQ